MVTTSIDHGASWQVTTLGQGIRKLRSTVSTGLDTAGPGPEANAVVNMQSYSSYDSSNTIAFTFDYNWAGHIWVSSDGGLSWSLTSLSGQIVDGIITSGDFTIQYSFNRFNIVNYQCSTPGYLWMSTDAGISWVALLDQQAFWFGIATSYSGRVSLAASAGLSSDYCFADSGSLYVSSNFGKTWLPSSSAGNGNYYHVAVDYGGLNMFATTDSSVLVSTDSGASWQPLPSLPSDGQWLIVTASRNERASPYFIAVHAVDGPYYVTALQPLTLADFTTPGAYQWTVPADISVIYVKLWGGGGSGGGRDVGGTTAAYAGGSGGMTYCPMVVTPGQTISLIVGGGGQNNGFGNNGCDNPSNLAPGGYGGGGDGTNCNPENAIGGGGGRSAIQVDGENDAATAGGGGAGGVCDLGSCIGINSGLCGGGLEGCSSTDGNYFEGSGGTQTSGGAGGVSSNPWGWVDNWAPGNPGSQYQGGSGGTVSYGGGGGGGYYGGVSNIMSLLLSSQ